MCLVFSPRPPLLTFSFPESTNVPPLPAWALASSLTLSLTQVYVKGLSFLLCYVLAFLLFPHWKNQPKHISPCDLPVANFSATTLLVLPVQSHSDCSSCCFTASHWLHPHIPPLCMQCLWKRRWKMQGEYRVLGRTFWAVKPRTAGSRGWLSPAEVPAAPALSSYMALPALPVPSSYSAKTLLPGTVMSPSPASGHTCVISFYVLP